jgi:hypothetical protein
MSPALERLVQAFREAPGRAARSCGVGGGHGKRAPAVVWQGLLAKNQPYFLPLLSYIRDL